LFVVENVIGIDMGIRHIATTVELASVKTRFYGKDLNRFRGHYFWLSARTKIGHEEDDRHDKENRKPWKEDYE